MSTNLLLLALITVVAPQAPEPTYKIETKGTNSVAAQVEKDQTIFVVTSERGLGWADILLEKGDWPEYVTLRFRHSEGKGFTALEGLTLSTDQIIATGSAKITDFDRGGASIQMRFAFLDAKGKPDSSELTEKNQAGVIHIQVKRLNGAMDVLLPARMLRGSSKFHIGWTDWYRR